VTNGGKVYTSFMQRAAIGGLFMGIWNSMVGTSAYAELQRKHQLQADPHLPIVVNGRIATWRTYMGYGLSWWIELKDSSLGGWSFTLSPTGDIRRLTWYPEPAGLVIESEIHFDDDTFVRMFETLRQAAAAYIRHYGFSVDQERTFVKGILHS